MKNNCMSDFLNLNLKAYEGIIKKSAPVFIPWIMGQITQLFIVRQDFTQCVSHRFPSMYVKHTFLWHVDFYHKLLFGLAWTLSPAPGPWTLSGSYLRDSSHPLPLSQWKHPPTSATWWVTFSLVFECFSFFFVIILICVSAPRPKSCTWSQWYF